MGLFDIINLVSETYFLKKIEKDSRKNLEAQGLSEEEIDREMERFFGVDSKKVNAELAAERKAAAAERRAQEQRRRQYLIDHRACSTCEYYVSGSCMYRCIGYPGYIPNSYYSSSSNPQRINNPDNSTCSNYKKD